MPAFLIKQGGTIQNVLVIAEKHIFGVCLGGVLQNHGYHVTIVDSYDGFSKVVDETPHEKYELVIVTNTSLPPATIQSMIPHLKAHHLSARIIVLSGYYPREFVVDLIQKGIDGFLPLPFEEVALLNQVAAVLSRPAP